MSTPLLATLLYHEVCDHPAESGFVRPSALPYKHTPRAFAQHLDAIAAAGTTPELVSEIGLASSGRHLLLTFDDGGKSAVSIADHLSRRNWKGHFFITTSRIGTSGFLTHADIRYLRACGHSVGSHSHTHPDIFRGLPRSRMDEEWRISGDVLEQTLGEPCKAASVPGGDISSEVLESAAGSNLLYIFTSEPRLTPARLGPAWVFGRVCIKNSTPVERVGHLAVGRSWARERALRRVRVFLSRALAPVYRRYVSIRTLEGKHAA